MELLEIEQRQWGPGTRFINRTGVPAARLGFAGTVVSNNAPATNLTSTSATSECNLLIGAPSSRY
jgi:hypothetical protein